MYDDAAVHGSVPVFPDKNALPCAESEFSIGNGDRKRRRSECGLDMGWHIIGTFGGVCEVGIVFGDELCEPVFQISARGRICVLLDGQTGGCVLDKNGAKTF